MKTSAAVTVSTRPANADELATYVSMVTSDCLAGSITSAAACRRIETATARLNGTL